MAAEFAARQLVRICYGLAVFHTHQHRTVAPPRLWDLGDLSMETIWVVVVIWSLPGEAPIWREDLRRHLTEERCLSQAVQLALEFPDAVETRCELRRVEKPAVLMPL